jgi:hypothetical protein
MTQVGAIRCPFCDAPMVDAAVSRRHVWRSHKVELVVLVLFALSALIVTAAMLFGSQSIPSP